MIDRAEEPTPAVLLRVEPRGIRAPQLIRPCCDDGAGMRTITMRMAAPGRRKQAVLAHQPQHAILPDMNALCAQAPADFAMALSMKRALSQHPTDRSNESRIVDRRARTALLGHREILHHRVIVALRGV